MGRAVSVEVPESLLNELGGQQYSVSLNRMLSQGLMTYEMVQQLATPELVSASNQARERANASVWAGGGRGVFGAAQGEGRGRVNWIGCPPPTFRPCFFCRRSSSLCRAGARSWWRCRARCSDSMTLR